MHKEVHQYALVYLGASDFIRRVDYLDDVKIRSRPRTELLICNGLLSEGREIRSKNNGYYRAKCSNKIFGGNEHE